MRSDFLFQGDVQLRRLPTGYTPSRATPIPPRGGRIIVAEGEATGHHHAINMTGDARPGAARFRDDGLARELEARAGIEPTGAERPAPEHPAQSAGANGEKDCGKATLFRDPALARKLVNDGVKTTDGLCVGFLVVEGGPVTLRHEEHDPILVPPGEYYVGGKREWNAGEERRVAD